MEFNLVHDNTINLTATKKVDSTSENQYSLIDRDGKKWLDIEKTNGDYTLNFLDESFTETEFEIKEKLDRLILEFIESEQSGTEVTDSTNEEQIDPFNPEDIKVHAKQFSLTLISEMIDDGDIDLNPHFQRNFVWNSFQKSRLIESILLRIPLPMFYFSEDNQGKITIVDGLQRLTTIKEFMDNKFPLKKLEYLSDSCDGLYFEEKEGKEGLPSKYKRWFKQTQFSVNVIDPSSPYKVKYDIFRRINTGGKPLNNQEIRNCLASHSLRNTIQKMVELPEFKSATDNSIKPTRMEDQEVAMRFLLFHILNDRHGSFDEYNGYMNSSLDSLTETFSKTTDDDLEKYIPLFSNSMKNAEYLFGSRHAFRKVRTNDIIPGAHKQLINKALFTCWSVLLSNVDHTIIEEKNDALALLEPLASLIENDPQLLYFLSYGTNGKNNLVYTFEVAKDLINNHLIVD